MNTVTIFSQDSCAPCASLKRYLDHKGVEYKVLNADMPGNTIRLTKLTGRKIVPTTLIGDNIIVGLNYGAIARALEDDQ